MTKKEFVDKFAAITGSTLDESHETVTTLFDTIIDIVKSGQELSIKGFGRFYKKEIKTKRVVHNMAGEQNPDASIIPAHSKLGFSSFGSVDRHLDRIEGND